MSLYSSSVPKQISSHDRGWSSTMVIAGSLGNRKRSPFGASPVMLLASPWRMPGQMKTASRWSLSTKWVEWCCFRGSRIWWPPRQSDRNVLFVEGIHVYVHMYTYIYSYINIYIYIYIHNMYIYIHMKSCEQLGLLKGFCFRRLHVVQSHFSKWAVE